MVTQILFCVGWRGTFPSCFKITKELFNNERIQEGTQYLQKSPFFSGIPLTPFNGWSWISHRAALFSKGDRLLWETAATIFFSLYLNLLKTSVAAAAAKSLQSCPTLCHPIDGSPPGSPIPGILQARTLEWVAISFSNAWKWKGKSLSRVRLLATPWTAAHQAPLSMWFSRQQYWSGVPLPSPKLLLHLYFYGGGQLKISCHFSEPPRHIFDHNE